MDFDGLLAIASEHPFPAVTALIALLSSFYIFYYRNIHPLSKYPGPFLAPFTNLWKLGQLWSLHLPDTLIALHEKHGDVVHIGPNQLSFRQGETVPRIYKAGRTLAKTAFYDGFTSFNPNLFGTQDEEAHSLRRRQMAHAFSLQSIKKMEQYIDVI
ncbi:hypothetical protein CEP54_009790 [Fusarium duplospermum]|uniref:Cytochrome P450 n=1 Tax=Fusarium duplospermum TaxID=1325734 RepID=A0A428PNT6_9HYPO|nr:hypothetical protein CEP54_009790 [Fusarium duplospermum]